MLKLDHLFSPSAVLQRGKAITIWGTGDEGRTVRVSLQGQTAEAAVQAGKWAVRMPPLVASAAEQLTVSDGETQLAIDGVAIGEVWIAGGQSNMEFPMRNLVEFGRLKRTSIPAIKLYGVPRISYEGQLEDDDFSEYRIWRPCTPEHLWFYSAVPFYFAVSLYEHYKVPIGIINCNVGGTRASSWAERSLLERCGGKVWLDDYEASIKGLDLEKYTADFKASPMNQVRFDDHSPARDKMWRGYSDLGLLLRQPALKRRFGKMGIPVFGPLDRNRPTSLYGTMVKTIAPFGNRGVIWYQGESDDLHADVYDETMGAVVDSWRELWQEELPFLMVQLAPYEGFMNFLAMNYVLLREKQDQLAHSKPGVYITNVMDAGMRHDIHPKQKKPVGERLALLARGKVYGEAIVCEAPEVLSAEIQDDRVIIHLANCGQGLRKYGPDLDALAVVADGHVLDRCRLQAAGNQMMVVHPAVRSASSVSVSYGRRNYCVCNIKNSAGIPVKPFSMDARRSPAQ